MVRLLRFLGIGVLLPIIIISTSATHTFLSNSTSTSGREGVGLLLVLRGGEVEQHVLHHTESLSIKRIKHGSVIAQVCCKRVCAQRVRSLTCRGRCCHG